MRYRPIFLSLMAAVLVLPLLSCGVPKTEHDKVLKALEEANQEKVEFAAEIDKITKEKESLSQQVAQLRTENEQLKAKKAPKPAASVPARTAPQKSK